MDIQPSSQWRSYVFRRPEQAITIAVPDGNYEIKKNASIY
jgi:hypothetical protein